MRHLVLIALLSITACTAGGLAAPSGGGGGGGGGGTTTIDVSLTGHPQGQTIAGTGAGFAPLTTMVAVGTNVRFVNSDSFNHTATGFAGTMFPSTSPFTSSAQTQSGSTLSGGFSSGTLSAGAGSQVVLADKAGTYLFGCFFHYTAPMRAVIVVQ